MLAQLLATKTAAAAVAACAVAAGAAGAATGTLPQGLQQVAHDTVGAPAPDKDKPAVEHKTGKDNAKGSGASATRSPKAVGPDATGAAKDGLCSAFENGGLATTSVAYRELAEAAGGAEQIAAYCGTDATPEPTDEPSDKATGKPTAKPTGKPSDKGTDAGGSTDKGSRPTDKPSATPSIPANG